MAARPAQPRDAQPPTLRAELIVQNGRLKGTSRVLEEPATFIGKSPACEFRLNVDGISPLHCLIVRAEDRYLLRDLESTAGTSVNGKRVSSCTLHNGDQIVVGPYHFQVRLRRESAPRPATAALKGPADSGADKPPPALAAQRAQVAAVAAQQVALTEWELRLAQREATLEKQQAQLAAHLEEKRRRLIQMHAQTQSARQALLHDRKEYQRQVETVTNDLGQTERELLTRKQQVDAERKRLFQLQRKLVQRYRRHGRSLRRRLDRQAEELAQALAHVEADHAHLQQQKMELAHIGLRLNAEAELAKRQWQVEQNRLHQEQAAIRTLLEARVSELLIREERLAEAEHLLEREQRESHAHLADMHFDVKGLEQRIRTNRQLLDNLHAEIQATTSKLDAQRLALQNSLSQTSGTTADGRAYPLELAWPEAWRIERWLVARPTLPVKRKAARAAKPAAESYVGSLLALAGQLADQRLLLVEHLETLAQVRDCWDRERQAVCDQMLSLLAEMQARGRAVLVREQEVAAAADEARARHLELLKFRDHLAAWEGRLRAHEVELAAHADNQQAALTAREETLRHQFAALSALSKRWVELSQMELHAWRLKQEAADKASQEYLTLNRERRELLRQQVDERSALVARTLALEQLRQEFLAKSTDPASAERRLQQLQRRWAQEEAEGLRTSKRQCKELEAEMAQLRARNQEAQAQFDALLKEHSLLQAQRTSWEQDRLRLDMAHAQMGHQLHSVTDQRDRLVQRLAAMRAEVESMAVQLVAEPLPPTLRLHAEPDAEAPAILPMDRAA